MVRLSSVILAVATLSAGGMKAPVPVPAMSCAGERFVAGERVLPSYDEAFLQCREEERRMTDPGTGDFEMERACYEVNSPGVYGDWQYGRIALDVVERRSGDAYTFETLWMCKQAM